MLKVSFSATYIKWKEILPCLVLYSRKYNQTYQMAAFFGVSTKTYWKWEYGESLPLDIDEVRKFISRLWKKATPLRVAFFLLVIDS